MSTEIELAISTCPNDTFAFHAILEKKIDLRGLKFNTQLLDIQQLNEGLFADRFDVAKASFHAAALLTDKTVVLPSGSALGFGVGPLLLASRENHNPDQPPNSNAPAIVLCPGAHTTATMLFRIFYADAIASKKVKLQQTLFSEIMPTLQAGKADFGVCIHEGRFTYADQGLHCVEDLGTRWEQQTQSPLPLGGILARRTLDAETISLVQSVINASVQYGKSHPDETLPTLRKHAQEFSDEVLLEHVRLYVNEWTVDLGTVGRAALKRMSDEARVSGIIAPGAVDMEVWDS